MNNGESFGSGESEMAKAEAEMHDAESEMSKAEASHKGIHRHKDKTIPTNGGIVIGSARIFGEGYLENGLPVAQIKTNHTKPKKDLSEKEWHDLSARYADTHRDEVDNFIDPNHKKSKGKPVDLSEPIRLNPYPEPEASNHHKPKLSIRDKIDAFIKNNSRAGDITVHNGAVDVEIDTNRDSTLPLISFRTHRHTGPEAGSTVEVHDKVKKTIRAIPKEELDTLTQKLLATNSTLPLPIDNRPIGSKAK